MRAMETTMSGQELDPKTTRTVTLIELGELVRARRKEEQLTQSQVAERIGVSAATLSRLERYALGSPDPDVTTLSKVTRWLGVSLADLIVTEPGEEVQERVRINRGNTPALVDAHLRADRRLDPKTAAALSELFRAAYDQFAKLSSPTNEPDSSAEDPHPESAPT
jgi:transcriptional regulator with XRE-family HTH domain